MDGLGRLERLLAEWQAAQVKERRLQTSVASRAEAWARHDFNLTLFPVAPELIQVARAAEKHRCPEPVKDPPLGMTYPCPVCQALATLARKLEIEEQP